LRIGAFLEYWLLNSFRLAALVFLHAFLTARRWDFLNRCLGFALMFSLGKQCSDWVGKRIHFCQNLAQRITSMRESWHKGLYEQVLKTPLIHSELKLQRLQLLAKL
jgi:hypothetical protein